MAIFSLSRFWRDGTGRAARAFRFCFFAYGKSQGQLVLYLTDLACWFLRHLLSLCRVHQPARSVFSSGVFETYLYFNHFQIWIILCVCSICCLCVFQRGCPTVVCPPEMAGFPIDNGYYWLVCGSTMYGQTHNKVCVCIVPGVLGMRSLCYRLCRRQGLALMCPLLSYANHVFGAGNPNSCW